MWFPLLYIIYLLWKIWVEWCDLQEMILTINLSGHFYFKLYIVLIPNVNIRNRTFSCMKHTDRKINLRTLGALMFLTLMDKILKIKHADIYIFFHSETSMQGDYIWLKCIYPQLVSKITSEITMLNFFGG